jgi:hypothetical protein
MAHLTFSSFSFSSSFSLFCLSFSPSLSSFSLSLLPLPDTAMGYHPYRRAFYDRLLPTSLLGVRGEVVDCSWLYTFCLHTPVNVGFFLFTVLGFTFGPGYQPVALLLLPSVLALVLYTRSVPSLWHIALIAWPALTIGQFFAFAGTFVTSDVSPWHDFNTIYVFPVSAGVSLLICIGLVLDRVIARYGHVLMPFVEIFFAFPMIWSGNAGANYIF